MGLSEALVEYVRACFTGLWIRSFEHEDALAEIAAACRGHGWSLAAWDVDRGLRAFGGAGEPTPVDAGDPLAAIRALDAMAAPDGAGLLILLNFHRFLGSPEVVQALDSRICAGKQARTFVVVLSPVVQIPVELEKQFVVLEHDLPGRDQLEAIARSIAVEPGEIPEGDDWDRVLDAAAGFTRHEAEGAFSLSLVRHGRLAAEPLWEIKGGMLKKSGLLDLHRGGETFADLGGLEALKSFCSRALRAGRPEGVRPRGVLLLGPPGSGKSALARALGNETGRPTLSLDVGALMGSLVGATEANVRQVLRLVDAMSPCVLMIDEVEKALAGVESGGRSDGGVSTRLFGALLTWLADHESDAFVVCTANDVSRLPTEFSRAERFDAVYFLDLPSSREREAIWELHLGRFDLDRSQRRPRDADWTGAEIRSCCRLAALLDSPLVEAARHVVPVATSAGESIERLRSWAAGRCLAADRPGVYSRLGPADGPRRSVRRGDPSNN
ncbi:AAA family ATPase [Paludisphaera rhizosphaerae]|uniref:AAA family ATPase n=1 Tax=Paludisphaera rhizosphaerae TaxID=2711216 RepID=UPI0013ECB650|nr:AAA family ATPase [Paludisphaera rhizosphaerae]